MKITATSSIAVLGLLSCLNAVAAPNKTHSLLTPADLAQQPAPVKLSDELFTFFNNNGCNIPKDLRDKVTKNGNTNLIPEDLRGMLGSEMNTMVQKIDGKNVNGVLHSVQFQLPGQAIETMRTTNADTYDTLNAMSLVDTNFSSFAYTMDCSGFLNTAIQAAGGIKSNQAEAAAKLALAAKKSMVAVRAAVFSPIALAINPDIKDRLTRAERTSLVYSLITEVLGRQPAAPDDTVITAWRQVALMWTSNQGSSSFQGTATFNGSSEFGAGIVSAGGNLSSGSVVGRNISFSNFDTYVIDAALDKPVTATLKDLYAAVETLVNNVPLTTPAMRQGDKFLVAYALPKQLCRKEWTLASAKSNQRMPGAVTAEWANGACSFLIAPAQNPAADERGVYLRTPAGFKQVEFSVPVSL